MKGKTWRIVAALMLVVSLVLAIQAMASATGEGVSQVSVTASPAEALKGAAPAVTISVAVLTGKSTDAWTGTVTVTAPAGSTGGSVGISGTGTVTVPKVYPADFAGADKDTAGTYSISASANISGQSAVTGAGSFDARTYIISASPTRIIKGATTTIGISTNESTWSGTITVTEPNAETSTASVSESDADAVYPTDFTGTTPSTAVGGVYDMKISVAATDEDTGTFDVQNPNPHVGGAGFSATTDACAGCHRTHTATAAKLLKSSTQYGLCTSCHDGTSANTNVVDGVYLGSTEGARSAGLRGGGFVNAKMDTDVDGSATSAAISSKHTIGATSPVMWGSGPLGDDDAGEIVGTLECGSCHNPHGNSHYRVLRPQPTGLSTDKPTSDVTVPDETMTNYTISYDASYYRDLGKYPTGALSQMTEWCGQCHQRYEAGAGSGSSPSGDDVFSYRHMTEGLGGECLKCHVAHGSSASMSGNAATSQITWPAGTEATWQDTGEDDYSRLLHIDNRGVCLQCHTASELSSN